MSFEAALGFTEEQVVCQLLKAKGVILLGVMMVHAHLLRGKAAVASHLPVLLHSAFSLAPSSSPWPACSRLKQTFEGGAFPEPANEGELCKAALTKRGELSSCLLQSWALWHPLFINPCSHTCSHSRTSGAPEQLLAPPTSANAFAPRASLDFGPACDRNELDLAEAWDYCRPVTSQYVPVTAHTHVC